MVERRSIMVKTLQYEGIMSVIDFYNLLDDWTRDRGYDKLEPLIEEIVKDDYKQIRFRFEPYKKTTDYANNMIRIEVLMEKVKDIIVELDGKKQKMQQGSVSIRLEGYLQTDYEGRFQNRPFYFFMREMFDKFIYKTYTEDNEGVLKHDVEHLWLTLRKFMNMYSEKK